MPRRSKVLALPTAVKAWLDDALVKNNFSAYEQLEAELKARGHSIGKSSLQRYGSDFEAQLAELKVVSDQARAVVEASPDDADDMTQALVRLVQQKTFRLLRDSEIDPSKVNFEKLSLNVARLARASVPLKRFAAETRAKLKAVLDAAEKEVAGGGEQQDALALLKRVREEAYGIFED